MISPELLMRMSSINNEICKSKFLQIIEDLQDYEFDYFCNSILGSYEFKLKYQGKCLTEHEKIINLFSLPIVDTVIRHYDPEYVFTNLWTIASPLSIIADILTAEGYDKVSFIKLIGEMSDSFFSTLCQEVRNLEYMQAINVGHRLIDCSIAQDVCEGLWWKVVYGAYKGV